MAPCSSMCYLPTGMLLCLILLCPAAAGEEEEGDNPMLQRASTPSRLDKEAAPDIKYRY